MKKYFLALVIIVLTINAQPNQYFANFHSWDIVQVLECDSGYYLVKKYDEDRFYYIRILQTDWSGKVIRDFFTYTKLNYEQTYPASLTNNGRIILGGTYSHSTYPSGEQGIFTLFNEDGSVDWKLIMNSPRAPSIIQSISGDFLGVVQSDDKSISIMKIDSSGKRVWFKDLITTNDSSSIDAQILKLSTSKYLVRSQFELVCIDDDANKIWQIDYDNRIEKMLVDDNNYILIISKLSSSQYRLTKFNSDGMFIWGKDFSLNPPSQLISLGLNNNSNYVLGYGYRIDELNQSGDLISSFSTDIRYSVTYLNRGGYDDMILTLSPNGVFTRANNSFESEGLSLSGENSNPLMLPVEITLHWLSYNVNLIDISYSTDNGLSWVNIETNYSATEETYSTKLSPEFYEDSVLVRIKNSTNPETEDKITIKISKPLDYPDYEYIATNEILMWISNNGDGSHSPITDGSGFFWPGGEDASIPAIFEEGLLYGCKLNGNIIVNGNTHRQGLIPGKILPDGLPDDPTKPEYKIFKYKKGWEKLPEGVERDKYEYNVQNWPVKIGAPFVDRDLNGQYNPEVDEPGNGADEYLFNVSNGGDSTASHFTYGSPPIPLELQISVYGYDRQDELKNVVFKKYKIINKGEEPLTDFYLTYWTDDDMGNANDDFVGCDTLLNMMYTYNGDENDESGGYGSPPPAVAHMFVQGPVVPGEQSDSAYFNDEWKSGYKNLPMTSFTFYIGASAIYRDPQQGVYEGTLEIYNYMQGQFWNGSDIIDPNTNKSTRYALAGDPVAGIGWYEGDGWPNGPAPDDRRSLMSSGPFDLAVQDTQEVVLAIFMARGTDRLNSITELRNTAEKINEFYYDELTDVKEEETLPNKIELTQNYPNPFNPSTKIKFSIPGVETTRRVVSTKLVVYDILGREIKTLLNKKLIPGRYEVEFEGNNLSSGVYLYRLQVGDLNLVKKMILLK